MTALSFGIAGAVEHATVRALAPELERLGFHALWVNDTPQGDSLASGSLEELLGVAEAAAEG